MSEFGKAFMELVVGPWHKQCLRADFPWMATPELRKKWIEGIASTDSTTSMSCAIGLARCANPSSEEFQTVNQFFAVTPENVVSDIVVLDLLLTGAAPPVVLADTFFMPKMSAKPLPPPFFWPLLAAYLRHPANAPIAKAILATESVPSIAVYCSLANPSQSFPEKRFWGTWYNALKIFHPLMSKSSKTLLQSEIERFAFFMRCDFTKEEFLQASRDMLLEDPFLFVQLHHPCAFYGHCPQYDPKNPSAEALKYFAHDYPVCSLYRYYNPLLNYPWMSEDVAASEDDGILMGLLLVGSVPMQMENRRVTDKKKLMGFVREHPAWEANMFAFFSEKISELPPDQQDVIKKASETYAPPSESPQEPAS